MTGKTILHYTILEKLGEGGMGVVYLAEDTKLKRRVAIKFLPHHISANTEERQRFEIEAKAAAALNHPNISTIYAIEESEDQIFIVMEYIDGVELKDKIRSNPLPVDDSINIATQIADGLEAAHKKGIVHRDIKSSNIMITKDGKVKIMDFGLAKIKGSTQVTKIGTTLGTVAYMSPEQLKGDKIDHRSDIFSLGNVFFEMITGQQAFKGDYEQAVIYSILNEDPEPITGLRSGIPLELERIVNKTLTKDPGERYQRIDEFLVDLKLLKKNFSNLAKQTATISPTESVQEGNRKKTLIPWIISILAICAAIILWIEWQATPSLEKPLMRFVHNLPPGYVIEDVEFIGSAVTLSPDGGTLVYTATDSGGITKLYRRQIDQFESIEITGTEGAGNPFFSPDGQWVGFFAGGILKKVSLRGGTPTNICKAQIGYGASWGTDDTIIFSPTFTSGLQKVSAAGGIPKTITNLNSEKGELSHFWPEILPDGKSVLFTINTGMAGDAKHIAIYSLISGEQRILVKEGTNARYSRAGYLIYLRSGSLMAAPFDIAGLEITGSTVKVLDGVKFSDAGGGQYSFSQNGSLVWVPAQNPEVINSEFSSTVSFGKVDKSSLLWIDRQGGTNPVLSTSLGFWAPNLSPDGKYLAITIDLDIFILDLDREALTRFTFEGRNHIPVWTPDGRRLVFSSARNGQPNLFWKMVDGSGIAEQLLTSKRHQDPGSFSPDGKLLVHAELHPETNWDIWLVHLENKNQSELFLQTNFNEYHPMISPDGRWLAYTSDESGQPEIFVRPFPTGSGKWLISTEGGEEPRWARGGKELFYRNAGKVMAVTIDTKPSFLAGRTRLLFQRKYDPREMSPFGSPNYDVGSDGRFLIIEPDSTASSTQINFVLNWFEELKRLVPN